MYSPGCKKDIFTHKKLITGTDSIEFTTKEKGKDKEKDGLGIDSSFLPQGERK